jgi:3-phenylpropionate/trans-cinnamate dioxygenase ferredoxin subunit
MQYDGNEDTAMTSNTTLHRICSVGEIESGESRRLELGAGVAIFNVDGTFYAVSDTCTHADASMADGYLEGEEIECPLHGARFCLKTGQALCQPATEPLQTFPVLIRNGDLYIEA